MKKFVTVFTVVCCFSVVVSGASFAADDEGSAGHRAINVDVDTKERTFLRGNSYTYRFDDSLPVIGKDSRLCFVVDKDVPKVLRERYIRGNFVLFSGKLTTSSGKEFGFDTNYGSGSKFIAEPLYKKISYVCANVKFEGDDVRSGSDEKGAVISFVPDSVKEIEFSINSDLPVSAVFWETATSYEDYDDLNEGE